MKILLSIFLLLACFSNATSQNSFEGNVRFKTDISITDLVSEDALTILQDKYGDSLIMYYDDNGDFLRKHLNSSNDGVNYQLYRANKGIIEYKYNDGKSEALDVSNNSIVKLLNIRNTSEKILNRSCNCIYYEGISKYNENVIASYCYNTNSPKLNPKLFEKHKDFYLNKFYLTAKAPYLKFTLQTTRFTLSYTAVELIQEPVDIEKLISN